jgi:Ca-activated chloride channel homolog
MFASFVAAFSLGLLPGIQQDTSSQEPGTLAIVGRDGAASGFCPLQHTDVQADIAGVAGRVTLSQTFTNPSNQPIEAIYTFPLPADAAVDAMTLHVGNRVVRSVIKKREEAQAIYQEAKQDGHVAGLLDQERPNIFTQSVANIMPNARVVVQISYVETVPFKHGEYEFVYPMVVGPRYTANAADPDKISPPTRPHGSRTGTDISLAVNLNPGADLDTIESELHQVKTNRLSADKARVELLKADEIPNRDFILHYSLAQKGVQEAFITHATKEDGGYFSLILNPPASPDPIMVAPKEFIFVIDQSGSQQGFPIEKSKDLTTRIIHTLGPQDTFTVLGFSNEPHFLWKTPRQATKENLDEALNFISPITADGGTELYEAVQAALDIPKDPERLRIVAFNTDGYVGDEDRILGSISARSSEARFFTFGIGNSVNRYLIDSMSSCGRGDSEMVTLASDADRAVDHFVTRTQFPILTNVQVQVDGVEVSDLTPENFPDVFSETPLVITGRYAGSGPGKVTVTGMLGNRPWSRTIDLNFPASDPGSGALSALWARKRITDLQTQRSIALIYRKNTGPYIQQITDLGLHYGLMTEYTSFVAVEDKVVNSGGQSTTVQVPVDLASGVSNDMATAQQPTGFGRASYGAAGGFGGGGLGGSLGAGAFSAGVLPPTNFSTYDPNTNTIWVKGPGEPTLPDISNFLKNPTDKEAAAFRMADRKALAKMVAGLPPKDQATFWFLVKVSKGLRTSKDKRVWVRIIVDEDDAKTLAKAYPGTLIPSSLNPKQQILFAVVKTNALADIAQLPYVVRVESANQG